MEKESAVRLELEDKIVTHMQHKLTHNKAAKYSQQLTSKLANLKNEKVKRGFRKTEKIFFSLKESSNAVTEIGLCSFHHSKYSIHRFSSI